jgi:hypothetical protein
MQSCFVIMPFRPELAFFFLTIRTTIQQAFPNVAVQRADDTVLTITILEKIVDFIQQADVIIADCSGRNPNVLSRRASLNSTGEVSIRISGRR